ncbi:sodium- and chloride-dependent transporter XTRP3-like isoform X2 [Stylophora pistillata]|uniref:Sodium-dependent neutral amino acid transporter B(0)AT1 n=2 Tax=Stylophora pistillata TaxID=50429 RepID=A0A2B4SV08_STYPI|nr:sodium- and chloride-dependent transporter XTRP3-like isoform X2 [Stylophora pistillata]XP_022779654.1 sodium- and chloride-dependent transporter XTRP3-like isoform X2 [Stylophora pistillata]XP_022779655.1 sodium- and chloride-dependent transporter XTRP3-like isoform X2 [Stylophora pistillata]XP_022779656.1 sodium- and chloride-dependent transporter XTRP3-like isoform X2 [Stylophora pistillata]XP_022779657.1 sodium- and chloride-dependent transporter XTRP3-like isoform X2 [Stylophora pistill
MSSFATQKTEGTAEVFSMRLRGDDALITTKDEIRRKESNSPTHSNNIREVSWAKRSPHNSSILSNGLADEIVCQTCSVSTLNAPMLNHSGRMSLPMNGKYAGNHYHWKCNGIPVKATSPQRFPHKAKGTSSQLSKQHNSHSGNITCCGSTRSRTSQEKGPNKPWKNKGDYFVAMLTYLLGVGNVIRFPQLCFKHGGGAFFIPYFIMLILEGIPLICLEMAVGQRLGRDSVTESWKDLNPSLRGIGMAATIESLVTCFYYNYIVAWCLYYFIHSMRSSLLWTTCPTFNDTVNGTLVPECSRTNPAEYYWYRETLDVADDINKSTGINMYLFLFVVISWTVSFLLTMRGLRAASKVLLVALIFIVTSLVTFFFVSVHLDGWAQGLARLFIPEWERLKDPVVWMDAAGQIFFSLGVGLGSVTLFSTGNQPKNSFTMDAIMCALGNCATSLWASIIMFSFFGFKALKKFNKCEKNRLDELRENDSTITCSYQEIFNQLPPGMSLGFAGLSEVFTQMSLSPVWSTLFYFLLFLLSSSSMVGMMEIVITTCKEIKFFSRTWRNEVICGVLCLAMCISNLLFVQSTGFYLLEVISSASSIPLLLIGLAECIGVAFVYGMERFSKDLSSKTGKQVKSRWKLCWKFFSPLIIFSVIVGGLVQTIRNGEFTYTAWDRTEAKIKALPYPPWAYVIYLFFVLIPSICLIYPPIMDRLTRRRRGPDIMQSLGDDSSVASTGCAPPCCIGRSRSYNIDIPPVSNLCVNGHVNRTVDEND